MPSVTAQLSADLATLSKNLEVHERVCQERWEMVCSRLKRLEIVIMSSAGAIICLLVGIVIKS